MDTTVAIEINTPKENVWQTITDIDNCKNVISSILGIKVLNKPSDGLVGLKWEETREMFGKEATETMWITDAKTHEFYATRAESHGSVYITRLNLAENSDKTTLTMTFSGIPQTFVAKILSFIMRPLINNSIKKALTKDLEDIKKFVENN